MSRAARGGAPHILGTPPTKPRHTISVADAGDTPILREYRVVKDQYRDAIVLVGAVSYWAPLSHLGFVVWLAGGGTVVLSGAALVLLGMTTVIEVFVYPQAWPTHIQWAAMLLVLLCRGPGALSLDHLLWRRFGSYAELSANRPNRAV